ncbi:hypothetical protein [Levilactobacillus sp. HBUAS70063]|uniref:hypothetical protein n=1 Tax=Levilactobacillus sp. HBUAS70063 TaxID=3109359 RepID=UPI003132AF77
MTDGVADSRETPVWDGRLAVSNPGDHSLGIERRVVEHRPLGERLTVGQLTAPF